MGEIIGIFILGCFVISVLGHVSFWSLVIGIPTLLIAIPYCVFQVGAFFFRFHDLSNDGVLNISCLFNIHDDKITEENSHGTTKVCRICKRRHYEPDLSYLSHPFNSDTY